MPSHILVVDDNTDITLMLKDRLNFLGYHATTASDGVEGLAVLASTAIDGVLLDVQMPRMDGLMMLTYIRDQYPHIPVIMMTAEFNTHSLSQAMEQGAQDYLIKPIDSEGLMQKCFRVFSPHTSNAIDHEHA